MTATATRAASAGSEHAATPSGPGSPGPWCSTPTAATGAGAPRPSARRRCAELRDQLTAQSQSDTSSPLPDARGLPDLPAQLCAELREQPAAVQAVRPGPGLRTAGRVAPFPRLTQSGGERGISHHHPLRRADRRARGARAGAGRHPLVPGPPARARARLRPPHAVPARPRPDRAQQGLPPAQAQDAGVHLARGRPLPHAADPHARGLRDRPQRGPGAGPERGPDRGHRAGPRPGPPAVRAHRRARPGRAAGAAATACASATTSTRCAWSTGWRTTAAG